jgi:hypothetical protein
MIVSSGAEGVLGQTVTLSKALRFWFELFVQDYLDCVLEGDSDEPSLHFLAVVLFNFRRIPSQIRIFPS